MKICPTCDQLVAEKITVCPSCGGEIGEGRKYIDDYRIVEVLHEGYASLLCRAVRQRTNEQVMIRLFTAQSGVNEEIALRLTRELEQIKKLPGEGFVRHHAIRRSSDGLWYRISEWVESENWGSLLASGRLGDYRTAFGLFHQMASILSTLHQEGYLIPHLILNDIMVVEDDEGRLKVKIDYKLSRFFDPKLDRPGPMLKRLLNLHPDIVNQRPLDFQSDVWSLGKIFVEVMTADLEAPDLLAKIEELRLPSEAEILIRVMLAEDPDLRPRSMAEVTETLARILEQDFEQAERPSAEVAPAPGRAIRILQKRISLLAAIVVLLIVFGFLAWFQLTQREKDVSALLEGYAGRYAPSVAFLLVDYWIETGGRKVYRNQTEGTAFLVDKDGYLLTNRHVACPWLEDSRLAMVVQQLRINQMPAQFGYRMYLWFEGYRAFNRAARLMEDADLTELYFTESAYSSEASPKLTIAGVAKSPARIRQLVTSPLRDDFAVLKIEQVPDDLIPLPLDSELVPQEIPKLSPFITLGFPLGSRSLEASVSVSVTGGHVRRSFENLIQVDASLYGGNSGGPIIDSRGKVIGIVSGVAVDWAQGLPMGTPIWNMGMVLPINRALALLQELKSGQVKWNGVLDLSLEAALTQIRAAARKGRWDEALDLVNAKLTQSRQPALVVAGGMLHVCKQDYQEGQRLLRRAISMDAENHSAKLMLVVLGRLGPNHRNEITERVRTELLSADWRSAAEFQGYLVRVLEEEVDSETALDAWYTSAEKSWLRYVVALTLVGRAQWAEAEELLRQAALSAELDGWELYLSLAKLEEVQEKRRESLPSAEERDHYAGGLDLFNRALQDSFAAREQRQPETASILAMLARPGLGLEDAITLLERLGQQDPDNRAAMITLAFYHAANEAWDPALDQIALIQGSGGRPTAGRMSLGLLQAGIFHRKGKDGQAGADLQAFAQQFKDPWYLKICDYLLGKETEEALKELAGESPEKLITAYSAMAFWAEGSGDRSKAIKYYMVAMESFMDSFLEFDFARERIKRLKRAGVE